MSRYTPPEPLRPTHDLAGFDSGNDALNRWLVSRAVRNQDSGASRTFVTTCDGPVVGYYALAASSVAQVGAPTGLRRNMPDPIPAGASEHPLGGLGFANWAFEVAEQEKALGVFFDTIIVCTVTGSTHAGMIAGFAALEELTGVRRRVIGIDASATLEQTREQVGRIARHTSELIELGRDLRDDEITVLEGWAGELYGVPVDSTMEAIRLGAQLEAMITDPVYEGKSLAGLIDLVRSGDIPATSTVLYAHLGGQPAINAYHRLWS